MSFSVPPVHLPAALVRLLTPSITAARPGGPPVVTTLAVASAQVLSTVPSLLPRSAPVQGVLSGVLVLLALGLVTLGRLALGRRPARGRCGGRWVRVPVLVGSALAVGCAALVAQLHLVDRSEALGMPAPPLVYWLAVAPWALLVVCGGTGLARLAVAVVRSLRGSAPRRLAAVLVVGTTVTTAASASGAGLLDSLRKELEPAHVMLLESPSGATRAFALVSETENPEAAAELAVERLVADGGLARRAVVVALPTGSGWVNDDAVRAVEAQLDGDVALVSAQAGDLPSWYYFIFDQEPARRAATALVEGVLSEVRRLPVDGRPAVYVVGESLGALVGQAAVAALPRSPSQVCGVLWSGVPGAVLSGHPHERSLRNEDDPVTYLSPSTAYRRPAGWPGVWLPLLSYGTTWLDLQASLRPPDGHGHRYGDEQDWSLPACAAPAG